MSNEIKFLYLWVLKMNGSIDSLVKFVSTPNSVGISFAGSGLWIDDDLVDFVEELKERL